MLLGTNPCYPSGSSKPKTATCWAGFAGDPGIGGKPPFPLKPIALFHILTISNQSQLDEYFSSDASPCVEQAVLQSQSKYCRKPTSHSPSSLLTS